MLAQWPLLSILVWLPIIAGGVILAVGRDDNPTPIRIIALVTILLSLVVCVPLYMQFDTATYQMQFVEKFVWVPTIGLNYHLGVDGISLPLVMLSTFTALIVVLAAWRSVTKNVAQYLAAFLIMQGMMVGVFSALDSILFYIFWEGLLIPMYLGIGIWGGKNRHYASVKFFLYTFLGSALMLVALLFLSHQASSFAILDFYGVKLSLTQQNLIFVAFFLAFAVKVPMWPVHTWLPDAHTEAPTGGSVVLAALMLKMGIYGFLRFTLPILPDASQALYWMMIGLSLVAVVYIGLVAIVQQDMKRLIAYSSIAHMGFATLGCFTFFAIMHSTTQAKAAYMGLEGAMIIMVSHGFSAGALFAAFGMLYDRMHTRTIGDFGGIAHTMPVFAAFFMVFAMANVGVPGTSAFVGEFMVILSSYQASFWVTVLASTTLILSASYTLWMYRRVFFGAVVNQKVQALQDIRGFELTVCILFAGVIFFLGIYPQFLLNMYHGSVDHLIKLSMMSKLS